jgi:hypothetical protein
MPPLDQLALQIAKQGACSTDGQQAILGADRPQDSLAKLSAT